MKRELRIRELRLLDSSRMRFIDHQQSVKQMELKRLDEEIKRKVSRLLQRINMCRFDMKIQQTSSSLS